MARSVGSEIFHNYVLVVVCSIYGIVDPILFVMFARTDEGSSR